MKNRRRNIPDPISPQNPVHQTNRTEDRVRDHLQDSASLEEDLFRDETALIKDDEEKKQNNLRRKPGDLDEESGL
jgi:hypothetical protein